MCKKAGNKLNALTRMTNILNHFRKNTLVKLFIKGQFNYCPLLWMFCSLSSNNLINKTHEMALSLTSEINDIPFNELLSINIEVSLYNKNGIRAIAAQEKLSPGQGWGLDQGEGRFWGWGQPENCPEGNCPWVDQGLAQDQFWGCGQFSSGSIVLEPIKTQKLLIEVYKNLNGLLPPIMLNLFTTRENIFII